MKNKIPPSLEVGLAMLEDADSPRELTKAIEICAEALMIELKLGITIIGGEDD